MMVVVVVVVWVVWGVVEGTEWGEAVGCGSRHFFEFLMVYPDIERTRNTYYSLEIASADGVLRRMASSDGWRS